MLPSGEASLKPNEKMKKYIIPNIETQEILQCFAICDPSAGGGQKQNPIPGTGGGPKGAPGRVY